jgi:glycosyltransferase involved in cell wall biosynthesis
MSWRRLLQKGLRLPHDSNEEKISMATTRNSALPEGREITVDIVIPVLNEAHVLERSVATVRQFLAIQSGYRVRVVVVDNGSTDGTGQVGKKLAEKYGDVAYVYLDQRGRGRALAYTWTRSTADIAGYMDVDLSTELEALPKALHAIVAGGNDIAVGSRLLPESRIRRSPKREVMSRVYNLLVKAVLRTRFSDAQCGFKVVTREIIEKVIPQVEDKSWFFDTELLVLAEKQGYRIKDIPVVWDEDRDTRVKFLKTVWEDILGILRLRKLLWSKKFVQMENKRATDSPKPSIANQIAVEPISPVLPNPNSRDLALNREIAKSDQLR